MNNLKMIENNTIGALCPNCNQHKMKKEKKSTQALTLGCAGCISTSCAMWIPVLGWILIPISAIISLIAFVAYIYLLFTEDTSVLKCENCGAAYEGTKEEVDRILKDR